MTITRARPTRSPGTARAVTPAIRATAVLMALGLLAFAVVNIVFEVTGHFADGPYAEYASGLSVMDWLVVVLKLVGAAVALLSVAGHQRWVSPYVLTVFLWGAFATLGVYALGSVAEAVGMAAGLTGSAADIDLAGVGYVFGFLCFATGFGVLAISYARRHRPTRRAVVLGVLGAPAILAVVLLVVPALLVATGVMPAI